MARKRGMKRGEMPGQAGHTTIQFHAAPPGVQLPTRELESSHVFTAFTWAKGLLKS